MARVVIMSVLEDRGRARSHLAVVAGSIILAAMMWFDVVDSDGLLSARLSSEAPRWIMAICALGLSLTIPSAVRVLVRPRVVLEVDGDTVSFEGRMLEGDVVARVPAGVYGERGTQEYGPVDAFCDGQKVTRLTSTRPHRAVDVVARLNTLGGAGE